jgi:Derlin-2/3
MSQLEKMNFNAPEDFFILMVFGSVCLLPLYSMLGLSTKFLGHNLSTYLVYIWGRIFEGTEVDVMGMFYLRAELLPWFFCAQTLVLEGEIPFTDLLGIVVGHLYYYLKQRRLLIAPSQVKSFFSSDSMIEKYAKFRADFELM